MLAIGLLPAIGIGTSLLGLLKGSRDQGRANDLREQALGMEMQRHRETAPLRAMGLGLAQQGLPQAPDFSAQFADPGNPFSVGAAQPPVPQPGPAMPGGPMPMGPTPGAPGRGAIPLPQPLRRPPTTQPPSAVDLGRY